MPTALVIGARNLGYAVIRGLLDNGWSVAGGAQSEETLAKVRAAGADALKVDVTDQASVLQALREVAGRNGRVDLVVNAAAPYGAGRSGPFGGGPLAEAGPTGFEDWSAMPVRGAFGFLSASAQFLLDQGGEATVVQVTGGSARRGMPGRGLWAAGAFGSGRSAGRRGRAARTPHPSGPADHRRDHRPHGRRRPRSRRSGQPGGRGHLPGGTEPAGDDARAQVTPALETWVP